MKTNFFLLFLILYIFKFNNSFAICLTPHEGYTHICARQPSKDNVCKQLNNEKIGYHEESCLAPIESSTNNTLHQNLFQNVIQTPDSKSLDPDLIKSFMSLDQNLFTEALIARTIRLSWKDETHYIEDAKNQTVDPWKDSEIQIAFNYRNSESIAKTGFKNFHEIKKSNGCPDCEKKRYRVENKLLKLNHFSENSILPKYGYYIPLKDVKGSREYVELYGEVIGVLNSSLKRRSLYSSGDSLNQEKHLNKNEFSTNFYTTSNTYQTTSLIAHSYLEAQIFGPLQFSDFKYFLLNCYEDLFPEEYLQTLSQITGKPVYQCEKKWTSHGTVFVPKDE